MSFVLRRLGFAAVAMLAACGPATPPATPPAPEKDPRVGLKAGLMNAGEAVSNLKILAKAVSPPGFSAAAPTFCDTEDGVFLIYAVAVGEGPTASPVMVTAYTCPASQNMSTRTCSSCRPRRTMSGSTASPVAWPTP
jgi:hypothetical protein